MKVSLTIKSGWTADAAAHHNGILNRTPDGFTLLWTDPVEKHFSKLRCDLEADQWTLEQKGEPSYTMLWEKGETTQSRIHTPYGDIHTHITCTALHTESPDRLIKEGRPFSISVEYLLSYGDGAEASPNRIQIEIGKCLA